MSKQAATRVYRRRRSHTRIRKKVQGTPERPRLAVFRSLQNIYVQAIDDHGRITIAHASSMDKGYKSSNSGGGNIAAAKEVGKLIAERLKEKGVETAVFDRGGYRYHGRIKALAEAAREAGLKI